MSATGPRRRGPRPRDPAPGWDPLAEPTAEAVQAWADARVDELVDAGYAALRARGHDVRFVDVGGLEAEIAVDFNLYAHDCVEVTVAVWRPRRTRRFPGSLLPRWRSSLAAASATLDPDGVLVEVEPDGERVPLER
jgi:hypothetical protein